jgi:hypothetical protein
MQRLWQQKLGWDELLNDTLYAEWCNFISAAHHVNKIKISRFVLCKDVNYMELHYFCDASEKAYAACIYAKTIDKQENSFVYLICAKTKVVPLKSLSIPRLQLCGALMLARLANKTKAALKYTIQRTIYWTDSTVVLSWINTSPHLLKSFCGQ